MLKVEETKKKQYSIHNIFIYIHSDVTRIQSRILELRQRLALHKNDVIIMNWLAHTITRNTDIRGLLN